MRLSSSFSGTSKGELDPTALDLDCFDIMLELLPCGVLNGGVLDGFEDGNIVDLVDFGVGVSMLSKAKGL
jgi:hypothetical protein